MAYTILKSDGTTLTTIADTTINTVSTSLGLPGRNYAGYGQALDTNFVHIVENFANATPPANPLRGQLWYDTNAGLLKVCPTDGEANAAAWETLTATGSGGTTTFGEVTVTGDISSNNLTVTNDIGVSGLITASSLSITSNATIANLSVTDITANGSLTTQSITTGAPNIAGNLTGAWTINGDIGGTALTLEANLEVIGAGIGIKVNDANSFFDANGNPITLGGTYGNTEVAQYLPTYAGNVGVANGASIFNGVELTTGANTTAGTITGNWTLTSGSRIQATYADLAERFAADETYAPGTVVELGGEKEITSVKYELSEDVFGVVSDTAAYLMNSGAGDDNTHPPVAMTGRVKVKVVGKVKKGQRLVSAGNGMARVAKNYEATAFNTIGRALEEKTNEEVGYVEAIVMIR